MMGTMILSRVAGTGEFSDEILAAGRDAVLDRSAASKSSAKKTRKSAPKKTPAA
jgi:TetR/AcrR family transcriptional repressor of nem operon